MRKIAFILGIATAAVISSTACADYFRWTDEAGTHYAETPPNGVKAEKVKSNGSISGDYDPSKEVEKTIEGQAEKKKQDDHAKEVADQEKKKADELANNCKKATTQRQTLSEKHRIRVMNPDGSDGWLSEDQRQAKLQETESFISANCQGK
ncbi:MAG TPA: DUF4124 domain-containing protein [Pseudomonadales bacterium]|nr:DUF4124 domain-containing protein [Pseudomonadales bacterium]